MNQKDCMMPLVEISNLKVAFDGVPVLHGIDLSIERGSRRISRGVWLRQVCDLVGGARPPAEEGVDLR